MALVQYQSPDDPAFMVFDETRFRVEHGIFHLRAWPLRGLLAEILDSHAGWDLDRMKLVAENRRVRDCLEWLDSLPAGSDDILIPELIHEPAIDLVADALIGRKQYDRVICPACLVAYSPERVALDLWEFAEEDVTVRGRRTSCPQGHTIHVLTEAIDAPDLESPDD